MDDVSYEKFAESVEHVRRVIPPHLRPEAGLVSGGAFAVLLLSIVGCATQPAKLPTPTPVATAACPSLKAYTPAEEAALNAQYKTLPPDSPVKQAFIDYLRMRDGDRACLGLK